MVLIYLAVFCKPRKHNTGQWYGGEKRRKKKKKSKKKRNEKTTTVGQIIYMYIVGV